MEEMEKKEKDKRTLQKELERKTREAINTLRSHRQSKSSSSDSSPERKQLLKAPAFVPIQPVEVPILTDENGDEVDKLWIAANKLKHDKSVSTIEELNRRIAQLEAEKREMEDQTKAKEMEMMKKDGTRMTQERMNKEMIAQLESQVKGYNEQVVWKDRKISQITLESEKKSDELNHVRTSLGSKLEEMKTRIREEKLIASSERREKESVMEMREREEEEKRRALMERKTACAKDAILVCTHIINKLATDPEAQVMASIFIDLRHKWTAHHAVLDQRLSAYKAGQPIDLAAALALKEPSMPRETDDLVQECYVWHYQTMHVLSFRLAGIVKKCLNEQKRYYEDAYIIGIIQKWMRMFKDPTKIEATVPQVANMVTQAMGDPPLMPPKYVHVNAPIASLVPMPPLHSEGMRTTQRATQRAQPCDMNEPKGWKKASEKMRVVALENGYECAICLDEMDGDDISYCEQVSCNEPYHNTCLDEYWKTGGRFCPRCRTPMPPRDAFPALG